MRNYDEDVPAGTIRAWTIGLFLTTIVSAVNGLFFLRYPIVNIPVYVVQLIAYPLGVGWARVMPNHEMSLMGVKFNLNPGPFNVKEHTIIVVMANAAFGGGTGYFVDTVVSIQEFYRIPGFGWYASTPSCSSRGLPLTHSQGLQHLVCIVSMLWA